MHSPQFKLIFLAVAARLAALFLLLVLANGTSAAETRETTGWPSFRGPFGDGHVVAPGDTTPVGLPLQWSETENVKWKTEIPFVGWSTPAVMEGTVWLTTATMEGNDFYVIGVDAETGAIRVNEKLFHNDNPEPLNNGVNCYASPSPVAAPGRVYVHFGSNGTAAIDTATGKVVWSRNDLPCIHYRGPGSSPILFEDLLILTFDGSDQQYVTALDTKTGKTVWRTDRSTKYTDLDDQGKVTREGDFRKGFSTPLVIEAGGTKQLISIGSMAAFAYEPRTGKEIWTTRQPGHTPAPCPVFANGLAYIVSGRGNAQFTAVRVDGHGDVSDTHVAWKVEGPFLPQEPSPIIVDGLVYLLSNNGMATCLDATTGAQVWSERIGGNHVASPIYADGRLYFCSTQGKTTVLRAGRVFEVLTTNELDAGFMASPAVLGKALILRTKTHLYRIEETTTK